MGGGKAEHVDKVKKSKFNRQTTKTDELRTNCKGEGYVFKGKYPTKAGNVSSAGQCQFHHVVPICSLQDGAILNGKASSDNMDFIHKCMAKTTWNTNKQPNLLSLPTKKPYENADRETSRTPNPMNLTMLKMAAGIKPVTQFGALPDLPCHLNDHPKYNKKVKSTLNKELWPELIGSRKDCKDKGKSIRRYLVNFSNRFKDWLKARGTQHGGAADCWVNRDKKKSVWYIPLSMAPSPTKVKPPPNIFKAKSTIRNWLKTLFDKIKL